MEKVLREDLKRGGSHPGYHPHRYEGKESHRYEGKRRVAKNFRP